jgi:glycosyltransferase involved in cell wall biosynthesis
VRAQRPDARFTIVGSHPSPAISRLASASEGIDVTGHVASVEGLLQSAAVSVAPLLTARGVQNKVLEAVAAGLPAIVTPAVFAGLPAEVHPACRIAETRDAFAQHVLHLLSLTGSERRRIAMAADMSSLNWKSRLSPLHAILSDAVAGAVVSR